jgi:sigma-B regulation protein RsbU (phosphoserine phosphatase)
MKVTLYTRLLIWVGVPAVVLFVIVIGSASRRASKRVEAQTEAAASYMAKTHAREVDAQLNEVRKIPEMIGITLGTGTLDTTSKVEAFLLDVVLHNPEIYGSCIAFRPYGLDETISAYAPYYYRDGEEAKFEQLGKPDYNYFQWPWYRLPRDAGHAMWTEPYFDDGGGNVIMITYSVPFRREDLFWGIATIDISMTQLIAETESIKVGRTGYAFIISQEGSYVAFPDRAKVMTAKLQETNPDLAQRMRAGEEGFLSTKEPMQDRPAWVAYVPIQSGELSLAIVFPEEEALAEARELRDELLIIGLVGLAGLFVALVVVARSISKPITRLAAAAQQVAQGDLEQRLSVEFPTIEVANLTNAFNKMTRDLQMRMQELRYTTTVKERFEGELNAARNIQMSLVPKRFPAFPDRPEFDVHALLRPAREVGGDFYDFYFLDDDRLCFLIGDVSGKGIPAALFMAVTKTLLKATSSRDLPIAQMMAQVNDELCEQTDTGMFVSLLFAVLEVRTGELTFCNSGHPSPFLLSAHGEVAPLDGQKDVALGAMSGLNYNATTVRLAAGDALFLYTDGVTEALNGSEHFYGPARLQITLKDVGALAVDRMTRGVVSDVRAFCGYQEHSDDISVVALRWNGPARPSSS